MSPDPETTPESEDPSGPTSAPEEDEVKEHPERVPTSDEMMATITDAVGVVRDAGSALGLLPPKPPATRDVILNQPKPGIGTTEFWITLVFAIVVVIAAADTATGAIAGAIAVAAYALSRGAVKIPAEWDKYKNIRFNSISAKLEELKRDGLDTNAVLDAVLDDLESMSDAEPSEAEDEAPEEDEEDDDVDDDVDPDADSEDGEDPQEDPNST